jgi:hypothetical protein
MPLCQVPITWGAGARTYLHPVAFASPSPDRRRPIWERTAAKQSHLSFPPLLLGPPSGAEETRYRRRRMGRP